MEAGTVANPESKYRQAYMPPNEKGSTTLRQLVDAVRPLDQQQRLGFSRSDDTRDITLYYAGKLDLVRQPCIAVVGTRKASQEGAARARRLARELVRAGIVVVSGLAEGVDTEALSAAIDAGGSAIAVIGTPLNVAYPAANKQLQETIYRGHLLLSQFPEGGRVFQSNFPQRNRVMAAVSDATVIIEASNTSGTLHQAVECQRLGRWLFIAKSIFDDQTLTWPASFQRYEKTRILTKTSDLLTKVYGR